MKKLNILVALALVLLVQTAANAGWVVTQRSYDSDEGVGSAITETVFMQDNIMKVVQENMITMFDLNKELMTVINPTEKVYWTGNIKAYKEEIKSAMRAAMEEQMANAAPTQKEMIKKMYQGMMEAIDNPAKFAGEEPEEYDLEINRTGEKERVAGRLAVKYEIKVNGMVKEESWISESDRAQAEFDINKFYSLFSDFLSQAGNETIYQNNEKYIEFSKKGFPLKSISYNGGYESISEVINLDKQKIDAKEFAIPEGYKKVNLAEIGLSE